VHINSGILNRAFYLAAMAMEGKSWEVAGRIWYAVLTGRLKPEADFADFTRATVDVAGELYGNGSRAQRILGEAWSAVGLPVSRNSAAKGRLHLRRASGTARRSSINHTQTSKRRTTP
jgi:hypothetical protein